MPTELDEYQLLKTLGTGANSKVKLACKKDTGNKCAIKILKKKSGYFDEKFLQLVVNEVRVMTALSHPNIVNLIGASETGVLKKGSRTDDNVLYIILELATGGELFEYVATSGRFDEPVARFFFHQLIAGLEYIHSKGFAHRDLKPENLLLDSNFNLKIADFGYSIPLSGRNGSGKLTTPLGTESYMAPEIHLRQPYNGSSVDLFAVGIILFIMITQHPPFTRAHPNDNYYNMILTNRLDHFWSRHASNKPGKEKFFSDDFKSLISTMLAFNPTQRPTIADIKCHPWYNGPVATSEEVKEEFIERKKRIELEAEKQRAQKEETQAHQNSKFQANVFSGPKVYRAAFNSANKEDTKSEEDSSLLVQKGERKLGTFVKGVSKLTEFFSTYEPIILLNGLAMYAKAHAVDLDIKESAYKVKMSFITEIDRIEIKAEVTKVEEGLYAVEFIRARGDQMEFLRIYNKIRSFFGELVNAKCEESAIV